MTYTYAILKVSRGTYDEIRQKLKAAAYDHAFHRDGAVEVIDMHGVALQEEAVDDTTKDVETPQTEPVSDPPASTPQADGNNGEATNEEAKSAE